ncbi:MAG: hypothetical protein JNL34_07635 [Anaerolineae bacterium]|nr:hypothetical protein [Anaerolineae bacterium]
MAHRWTRLPEPSHRSTHHPDTDDKQPGGPASTAPHPLIALQRQIGNAGVQRLLRDEPARISIAAGQAHIQREDYGYEFSDDPLMSGGTGGSSSYGRPSESGGDSGEGYGYGTEDDPLMSGGTGGSSSYGGSSESGGDSGEGYGYGFGDDPLAAGGFGANEYY